MIDSPFDVKEPKRLEGILAPSFLICIPFAGRFCGWLGSMIGDYRMEASFFGYICFYALSIGFSISALRQSKRSTRICGGLTLLADIILLILAVPSGMP